MCISAIILPIMAIGFILYGLSSLNKGEVRSKRFGHIFSEIINEDENPKEFKSACWGYIGVGLFCIILWAGFMLFG